jgi:hypothetical protein
VPRADLAALRGHLTRDRVVTALKPDLSVLRLDRWLFRPGSPEQLAALRIGLFGLLALRIGTRPDLYLSLPEQPAALFRPLSFMKLFDQMPPEWTVILCLVVGVPAAVLASVGFRARVAMPVAWLCAVWINCMLTSQGKVIHNDVLLLLCAFPLLLSRASDAWSVDAWLARRRGEQPPRGRAAAYGWPVRTAMVVVALAYFITGLHKLQYSGLAWATSDNLRWVLYTASDSQGGDTIGLFVADRPLLAHLLAWGTLVVEVGFPVVLLWPWTRWLMVPAVVGLHAGIWVTMNLNYLAMAATVVIVYTNWPAVVAWLRRRVEARRAMRPATART